MKDETSIEQHILNALVRIGIILDERLPKEEPAWMRDGIIPTLQGSSRAKEPDPIDDATNARYEREDAEARQSERRVNVTITDEDVPASTGTAHDGDLSDDKAGQAPTGTSTRESASAGEPDDLPGEPVEPSDLRAGDKVAFTWDETGERIITTIEGKRTPSGATMLFSGAHDSNGYYPNLAYRGEWCHGISNVRLIERGPREDEDPDEALARVLYETECEVRWEGAGAVARDTYRDLARAAREHIFEEQAAARYEERITQVKSEYHDYTQRAEKAEADLARVTKERDKVLIHIDHLIAENARLREGIADARMYCSRSTFCVTTWPTTLPGSPA